MRDHELELIAALVEGRLDDESSARALIDSSAEARKEYEAQKVAFNALRNAGTASMTDSERTALHRDVWSSLRGRTASGAGRRTWHVRLAAVAAGLFVLVGLAAVLTQGGADQGAFEEIAGGLAADGPVGEDETADRDAAGGDDAAGDGAETFEDAAATTTAAASEPASESEALPLTYLEEQAARVRAGEFSTHLRANDETSDEDFAECLAAAGLDGYSAEAILTPPPEMTGGAEVELVAAVPEASEEAEATVAFVDLDTCQLIHIDD